jgi:hypothetical protein
MAMKTRHSMALLGAAGGVLVWLVAPSSTGAYTVSTLFTAGCHEKITSEALRAVRLDVPNAGPLPLTKNERALVDDLEFTPPADMKDLGGATLLVSVRDNDLKGRGGGDLALLATVHGNPDNQDEHCLRNQAQDEPDGSEAAVTACRVFIRGRIAQALDGLGATGAPDLDNRTALPVHLALRGSIDADLPTYYVRIGQAIHAIEDSFTHTYRTPDGMKITVVLNWIDEANGILTESRDGPAHAHALDACNDPDDLRATRRRLATEAAVAILRTTLDPLTTKDAKLSTVDGILDTYLSYSPGCTLDNNWCDAPEIQYKDKTSKPFGCSCGGGGAGLWGAMGALLALARLPRRRRKIPTVLAVLLIGSATALAAPTARAAEPSQPAAGAKEKPAATEEAHAPPAPVTVPVPQPGPRDPSEGAWGGYLGASGSVDRTALATQLGIRRRLSTHWTVGWDAEWNPWVTLYGPKALRPGSFNTYSTIILRFPLAYENFNIRTTLNLGFSYLLFDLYGAPKGSLGFYGGISPLGVEWKLSRAFWIIINPLSMAVPVPQTKGVPLSYPQYRFSIGLSVLAG